MRGECRSLIKDVPKSLSIIWLLVEVGGSERPSRTASKANRKLQYI